MISLAAKLVAMIVALFFAALFFPAIDARAVCQEGFYIDEAIDMFSELIFLLGTCLCIYNGYCEKMMVISTIIIILH